MFGLDFGILTFTWIAYSSAILATRRNWSQLTPDSPCARRQSERQVAHYLPTTLLTSQCTMATLPKQTDDSKEQQIPEDVSIVSKKRPAAPITEEGDRPQKKFYRQRGKSIDDRTSMNFPYTEVHLTHSLTAFLSFRIQQPTAILFRITTLLIILYGLIL
jgi:hypothetical protein